MPRHHLIISGTGRAGTTFLVQLLTALGKNTGFEDPWSAVHANCNAGMEVDIRSPDAPYIVKSPWLCDHLDEALDGGSIAIDHALVPIRDLFEAAESRRDVNQRSDPSLANGQDIPGGLWHTRVHGEQEAILCRQLYRLMEALARREIPTTLMDFPRFVNDPSYLYRTARPALEGVDYPTFLHAFQSVSRPELVHDFKGRKRAG